MRSRKTVKIALEPYLKSFLIAVYGQPPVSFPQRDKLNYLLELLLRKEQKNKRNNDPEKDFIEIILPQMDFPNSEAYNYLSPGAQKTFRDRIKLIFLVEFEVFLSECFKYEMGRKDALFLFIERYELPENKKLLNMLRRKLYESKRLMRKFPPREYRSEKSPNLDEELD